MENNKKYQGFTIEEWSKKSNFVGIFAYEIGDEVIRFGLMPEIINDKLKTRNVLKVTDVYFGVSGDICYQLIKLSGIDSWETAISYRPADDEVFKKFESQFKSIYRKGAKSTKSKTKKRKEKSNNIKNSPTLNIKIKK